ncbi:hypothetical protein TYRP_021510 [Tyrophagus putrescentiae]|nr:hypothetical protein TYRP_021510 [Tyrophagus putrescentiae]
MSILVSTSRLKAIILVVPLTFSKRLTRYVHMPRGHLLTLWPFKAKSDTMVVEQAGGAAQIQSRWCCSSSEPGMLVFQLRWVRSLIISRSKKFLIDQMQSTEIWN